MPLRYVFDENMRGMLVDAVERFNRTSEFPIDVVQVGDLPELPRGLRDPELLLWAERAGRIIVTSDYRSMPGHLNDHLARGNHSLGVFVLIRKMEVARLFDFLSAAAHASEPQEWRDRIEYIRSR